MPARPDEFDWIASLRPLARGDERALALMDDAAILTNRRGSDLVASKDAMAEGVHFPRGLDRETVARRLLRTSLSDLAAKAAEPFGFLLMTAWPPETGRAEMDAFRRGLALDGATFSVTLLGGDTIASSGGLCVAATVFGWAPKGRAVLRSGAREGDALVVCGAIGDGWLGLKAFRGEIDDPEGALAAHYLLPAPLLGLRRALRTHARAAADVSDGLLADAGHIAEASGLAVEIDLAALPLSAGGAAWLRAQGDPAAARLALASGGDDYALACATAPEQAPGLIAAAKRLGLSARIVGRFAAGAGVTASLGGAQLTVSRAGWRH